MPSNRVIDFQLTDENGRHLMTAGGQLLVLNPGTPDKVSLFDVNQAALAQPVAGNRGRFYCQVAKAQQTVDLIIYSPTGHCVMVKNVTPGDRQTIQVDTKQIETRWIVPFAIGDAIAATEKDTGLDLPTGALVSPDGFAVDVTTLDAGQTITVGILSTEPGGSASGFVAATSIATAGVSRITLLNGTQLLGTLLRVQDSINAGDLVPANHVVLSTSKSISYTLNAGTDTGKGFFSFGIHLALTSGLALQ